MGVEIKVEDLTKSFGKALIWKDVTLTVPAGEICVMLGPSGTGKSVLLKTLIGLLKPDQGSVVIDGEDITPLSTIELKRVRAKFGMVFQNGALFDSMTNADNVAFPLREHRRDMKAAAAAREQAYAHDTPLSEIAPPGGSDLHIAAEILALTDFAADRRTA